MTSRARLVAALAALAVTAAGLLAAAPPASATGDCTSTFSGRGTGTSSNPYQVGSRADLAEVAFCLDKHFRQTADIDLGGTTWAPLGNLPDPSLDPPVEAFTGTYDGGSHAITGLYINDTSQLSTARFLGLFGVIDGATIKNLSVAGSLTGWQMIGGVVGRVIDGTLLNVSSAVTVTGEAWAGGLIGQFRDESSSGTSSTVSNCHASGDISAVGGIAGGLIGETIIQAGETITISGSSATGAVTAGGGLIGGFIGATSYQNLSTGQTAIADSWASGDVTSTNPPPGPAGYVGGFIGGISQATVTRSFATGNVLGTTGSDRQGPNYVGGFAGGLSGTISDSFAAGAVHGDWQVGGIVGEAGGSGSVVRTYAVGLVTGTGGARGGFAGYSDLPAHESMWDEDTSGESWQGAGNWGNPGASPPVPVSIPTGMTTAQMTTTATFADLGWSISPYWDGGTTWAICPTYNSGYPYLPSTLAANPTGCPLAPPPAPPAPAPAPAPAPSATPTPTPAPTSSPEPFAPPLVQPVAPSVVLLNSDRAASTTATTINAPAGRSLANAPTATRRVGQTVRLSVGGVAPSTTMTARIRVANTWHVLAQVTSDRAGRVVLPAFTTTRRGAFPIALGVSSERRYIVLDVTPRR